MNILSLLFPRIFISYTFRTSLGRPVTRTTTRCSARRRYRELAEWTRSNVEWTRSLGMEWSDEVAMRNERLAIHAALTGGEVSP